MSRTNNEKIDKNLNILLFRYFFIHYMEVVLSAQLSKKESFNGLNLTEVIEYWIRRYEDNTGQRFSAGDFCDLIKMKQTYFSRLRRGNITSPTLSTLARVSEGFGVDTPGFLSLPYQDKVYHVNSNTLHATNNKTNINDRKRDEMRLKILDLMNSLDLFDLGQVHGYLSAISNMKKTQNTKGGE